MTICGRLALAAPCQRTDPATADVPVWRIVEDSFAAGEHAQPAAVTSALLPAELELEAAPSEQPALAVLSDQSPVESAPAPEGDAAKPDAPQQSKQRQVQRAMASDLDKSQSSARLPTRGAMAAETDTSQPDEQHQAHPATAAIPSASQSTQQCQSHDEATAGAADASHAREQRQVPEGQRCAAAEDGAVACRDAYARDQVRPACTSRSTSVIAPAAAQS